MLILRVVSEFGRPLAAPLLGRFDEAGGTIGRSPDCTLVLPDPGKHISRQQARVDWADGAFVLTCLGSANSMIVNGAELATGESVRLNTGDSLLIAQYELSAELVAAAAGLAQAPGARPSAPAPGAERPRAAQVPILEDFDPFAEGPPPRAPADLFPSPTPEAAARSRAAPSDDLLLEGIAAPRRGPVDDPLAALGGAHGAVMDSSRRDTESIDALFGLSSAPSDPLGIGSPLSAPPSQPNTAASSDPLASLSTAQRAPEAPQTLPDRGTELSSSFKPPEAIPPTTFGLRGPSAPSAPSPAPEQASPFLSWETPPEGPEPAPRPGAAPAPGAQPAAPPARAETIPPDIRFDAEEAEPIAQPPEETPQARFERPPRTGPTELLDRAQVEAIRSQYPAGGEAMPAGGEAGFELLKALLLGLGLSELPSAPGSARQGPPPLSPELMKRIGELLRVSTQGTIDLLQARATVKREMKADVTMIVSSGNNPLKFSPDAQSAIAHLLAPQAVRGFMPPVPAMRDAYDDLIAHQVAFIAGMRAAMQGLIARFDPQQLETRLTRKSVLDSMLPMARRARLWELFNELFAEISREAEDDFETFFGREFVRAYEAQIAQLKEGQQ